MEYPRPVMKTSELKKMGFPEKWLLSVYRLRGQKIAWKSSQGANSDLLFDTEALEKYRIAQCVGGRGT